MKKTNPIMKHLFTKMSLMIIVCFICFSCEKNEDPKTNFPATVDGIWAGANASTGYTCNTEFTTNASSGTTCKITLTSPDKKTAETFDGRFTYEKSTGKAQFTSDKDGAPVATFQYNGKGTELTTSIKSATIDYGTYKLAKVTYPSSIAGAWAGADADATKDKKYSITFSAYSLNGITPATFVVTTGSQSVEHVGDYSYNAATGVATITFEDKVANSMNYNAKTNMLEGTLLGNVVKVERIAAK